MSNGQRLFVYVPGEFYKLDGLTTLAVNLLALTAAFGQKGLILSDTKLAELFNCCRRTIINSVQLLRQRGYVKDAGRDKQHRCLVASGAIIALLDRAKITTDGAKTSPQAGQKLLKTGAKAAPIKELSKQEREKKESTALPLPAGGQASALLNDRKKERKKAIEQSMGSIGKPVNKMVGKLTPAQFEESRREKLAALRSSKRRAEIS